MKIFLKSKSFTLIEILVVIVVIGILSGIITISLSSYVVKANDGIRKQNLGVVARNVRSYAAENGSYLVGSCRIETGECLDGYIFPLPKDPVDGYYGYSSTGSDFMLIAKGSSEPIIYTDSNGFGGSIVAISNYYGFKNRIETWSNTVNIDDTLNGALWGYVATFDNGWAADVYISKTTTSYGFEPGDYDVYVRLRTDGSGSYPTSVTWGIYNSDTAVNMYNGVISGLTDYYQIKYLRRITLSEENMSQQIRLWFSDSSHTDTQYFVDYVEFRVAN